MGACASSPDDKVDEQKGGQLALTGTEGQLPLTGGDGQVTVQTVTPTERPKEEAPAAPAPAPAPPLLLGNFTTREEYLPEKGDSTTALGSAFKTTVANR